MTTVNTIADTLNANYKQVYGDDIEDLIPDGVKVLNDLALEKGEQQQGGTYNQPVALGLEHGITFEAGDAVANLNAAVAGKLENAQVTGFQIVGRAQFGWTAAQRAASSKNAFEQITGVVLRSLMKSCKKKGEALALYGGGSTAAPTLGLGTVSTNVANVIVLTVATTAEGIWAGMVGMLIDAYTSAGLLRKSAMKITAVSLLTTGAVQLTVDDSSGVAATDVLHFLGAFGKTALGIRGILDQSTTSLFGVSQTTYADLWKGSTYAVGGQMTYAKIVKGLAIALPKGGEGRFKVYLHQESWQDVANEAEIVPTGNMDSRYKPKILEKGVENIKFHSVAGVVELVPSTYVKRGDAFALLQDGSWKRIGSTDFTMKVAGVDSGAVFMPLPNAAGFEVRCYADFAPFCDKPAASVYYTGVTQSA